MFGDEEYLAMFVELYTSTMRYLQLPINSRGFNFLVSPRCLDSYVPTW